MTTQLHANLVRYCAPIQITSSEEYPFASNNPYTEIVNSGNNYYDEKGSNNSKLLQSSLFSANRPVANGASPRGNSPRVNNAAVRISSQKQKVASSSLIDITRSIIPNRKFVNESGIVFEQTVSVDLNSRSDVQKLSDNLDKTLAGMQVRPTPVCPAREQLFSSSFDELIRQVTLEQPSRGLLLLRIRDELRLTIACHLEIFRGSSSFCSTKLQEADASNNELERVMQEKSEEKRLLTLKVRELEGTLIHLEVENQNRRVDTNRVQDKLRAKLLTQANILQRFVSSLEMSKEQNESKGENSSKEEQRKEGKNGKGERKKKGTSKKNKNEPEDSESEEFDNTTDDEEAEDGEDEDDEDEDEIFYGEDGEEDHEIISDEREGVGEDDDDEEEEEDDDISGDLKEGGGEKHSEANV